jgi:hypothetical protein
MNLKSKFSWLSLVAVVIINGLLLGGIYFFSGTIFKSLHQMIDPLLADSQEAFPEEMIFLLQNISGFLSESEKTFVMALFALGGAVTLVLWLVTNLIGRYLLNSASQPTTEFAELKSTAKKGPERVEILKISPAPAIQLLSLLQRQGRLIDFLQEDLNVHQDEQIGAAVRNIHEGCKKALSEHIKLEPIFGQEEGAEITVPSGFDANEIRLTGNVSGEPPFKGAIRHKGWKVVKVDLPQLLQDKEKNMVLAPAEVEVS